jgi:FHS family L-fucose permease-like MFS transporter
MTTVTPSAATAGALSTAGTGGQRRALVVLTSLFFMWGLITSLNDILVPHLKAAFDLSYVEAMLIQFCFFGAYFVTSFPSGYVVERLGYKRGIVMGLAIAGIGCLLFYPAADLHRYGLFLGALFVLASGITLLQVAANPFVAILGNPATASSRLTLTQAFNSLGTTIGPYVGAGLILGAVATAAPGADRVQGPYLGLAGALFVLAGIMALIRLPVVREREAPADAPAAGAVYRQHRSVWQYRHLVLGALAIFVYVGAEVSIGSFLVNFMGHPRIASLPPMQAGQYLALYWGGAMIGRFVGSAVMTRIRPGRVLAFNAAVAIALIALAMIVAGHAAMWAMLAVGLFNSVMFPTIFTLAIDGLGPRTGEGSGVLCMAIVGGALVPVLMGAAADHLGLLTSFVVPIVCYAYIIYYGLKGHYADFDAPARGAAPAGLKAVG